MATLQREKLGEVTAPSGRLVLLDVGQLAFAAEIQPAGIEIAGLPRRQPLFVVGERGGPDEPWRHVDLEVQPGVDVGGTDELGDLIVDATCQVLIADELVVPGWVHDRSLDGQADLVFWGDGAAELADALEAPPRADEGADAYGWRDLPEARAVQRAEMIQSQGGTGVDVDLRPHSHHFQALEQVRRAPTASASFELRGARVCLFHTLGAEGLFAAVAQRDDHGQLVRVRLAFPEAWAMK